MSRFVTDLPYLPLVVRQVCLSKQYRPRSVVALNRVYTKYLPLFLQLQAYSQVVKWTCWTLRRSMWCTNISRLALWVKISADDILKYFSYFPQKTDLDISCKFSPMETACMVVNPITVNNFASLFKSSSLFHFCIRLICMFSEMLHWWVRNPSRGLNKCRVYTTAELRARFVAT